MIVIVNGADFSKNNLGQIPIEFPLEPFVKRTMQNLTKYPALVSNGYAQSLNKLYKELVAEGIWSKLAILSIPVMAKDVSECAYNVIAEDKQSNALTTFATYYALDSDGWLRRNSQDMRGQNRGFDIALSSKDLCMFGVLRQESADGVIISAGYDTNYYNAKSSIGNPSDIILQVFDNGVAMNNISQRLVANGAFVVNYHGGNIEMQDSIATYMDKSTSEETQFSRFVPLSTLGSAESSTKSLAIYGCGVGLTSAERSKLFDTLSKFALPIM